MVRIILGTASFMLMWTLSGEVKAQANVAAKMPTSAVGCGETADTAKKDALKKAVEAITFSMRQHPRIAQVVTEEFVRDHVYADDGKPGEDIKLENFADPFKSWVVTFRSDYGVDLAHRLRDADRRARAEERQTLTSRGMLGLSLLLLAGVGYVRLDEYTNRRYTRLLRAAGLGALATVAVGWWWMIFGA